MVRLGLDDQPADAVDEQLCAEQCRRDERGFAVEEVLRSDMKRS